MILLDTNVISEAMKPRPEPAVLAWIDSHPAGELWVSTIVVAEVLSGLELMPPGKRQKQLKERAFFMFDVLFAGRILGFDLAAARAYGIVLKNSRNSGRPIDELDGLIAAIALAHDGVLSTRNVSHFDSSGIKLVNPWI